MNINNIYEVIKIADGIWRLEENGVRSFLITGFGKALLIDTGFGTGNIKEAIDTLTQLPLMLINTHADRDHVGCNAMFEKTHMHPSEYDRYHQAVGFGRAASPLWEGDIIDIGSRSFEVILIPGHTPGSIALLDAQNRVLISGDSVQAGNIFMFGPGRNVDSYICSLEKLRAMRSRFDIIWPSHGPFPLGPEILDGLIEGAGKLKNGELNGIEPPFEVPAKLYDAGVAKFLY